MAGSYHHLLNGWSLMEDMGDAAECVEELFWLVEHAIGDIEAGKLLLDKFYPMKRGELPLDQAMLKVRRLMDQ